MTQDQINAVQTVRTQLRASLKTVCDRLDTPALDGTPFLLVADAPGGDGPRVWGEFLPLYAKPGDRPVKGWLGLEALPHSLCGAVTFSEESIAKHIAALPELNCRRLHWRDLLSARQGTIRDLLQNLPECPEPYVDAWTREARRARETSRCWWHDDQTPRPSDPQPNGSREVCQGD